MTGQQSNYEKKEKQKEVAIIKVVAAAFILPGLLPHITKEAGKGPITTDEVSNIALDHADSLYNAANKRYQLEDL